jgi:hypothetical protein
VRILGSEDTVGAPQEEKVLGGGDHDYVPHGRKKLGGGNHDYLPHTKKVLGGGDHDYLPHDTFSGFRRLQDHEVIETTFAKTTFVVVLDFDNKIYFFFLTIKEKLDKD